uniref:Uncharacterized protein n=1 Tax=Trichogramma kaykai TaxID=54128 RepID=A0ABD2VYK5_9HYME
MCHKKRVVARLAEGVCACNTHSKRPLGVICDTRRVHELVFKLRRARARADEICATIRRCCSRCCCCCCYCCCCCCRCSQLAAYCYSATDPSSSLSGVHVLLDLGWPCLATGGTVGRGGVCVRCLCGAAAAEAATTDRARSRFSTKLPG